MSRTQNAVVRGRWIGRAGLWAALGLTLAAGVAAPTAGAAVSGALGGTVTTVVADGGTSSTNGNGWGG